MNLCGGGCPLCGEWEGYHGGTGLPCDACQAGYQGALKNLPEGTSIVMWYGAKSAAEEILASGGTKEAAQDKMEEVLTNDLKGLRQRNEMARQRLTRQIRPESVRAERLLESMDFSSL